MPFALAWMLFTSSPSPTTTPSLKTPPNGWVRVWTDRETPYTSRDPVSVYVRVDRRAYVTAFRIDTDGRIAVLYPREPWGNNAVPAFRTFSITTRRDRHAFRIDDDPGMGYLFVVASPEPFDYSDLLRADDWDFRLFNGGRIRGDPYVALTDLAERISPGGAYDYDVASYDVGRAYDYPRFVCAQCHAHPRDRDWDEYRLQCARFRLEIYDDPAYSAYRSSRGRNVVVNRPLHPGPRFVFRDAAPGRSYVTRRQGLSEEADRRRARELSPARPLVERHEQERRRTDPEPERRRASPEQPTPRRTTVKSAEPADDSRDRDDGARDDARDDRNQDGRRTDRSNHPRSEGDSNGGGRPELRRRKP